MAKRADWKLIKKIKKSNLPNLCDRLIKSPLIRVHSINNSKIAKESADNHRSSKLFLDNKGNIDQYYLNSTLLNRLKELGYDHYTILNETCLVAPDNSSKIEPLYESIFIHDDYFVIELYLNNYIKRSEVIFISCKLDYDTKQVTTKLYCYNSIKKSFVFTSEEDRQRLYSLSNNAIHQLMHFFNVIDKHNKYAFTKQAKQTTKLPPKAKKQMQANPYNREDLVSIIFLNRIPSIKPKNPPKGGTHASPRPHKRSGFFYTLKADRYKKHPNYKKYKAMYKKPIYVGDKEKIVNGVTYIAI